MDPPVTDQQLFEENSIKQSRKTAFQPNLKKRVILILLVLVFSGNFAYNRLQAAPNLRLEDLPLLPLNGIHRLLVIAPHPDDETLAAGGIIQQAIAAGIDVEVIVVTNGDGQALAPLALHLDLLPRPKDYIADGKQRQTETVNSLRTLGLPSNSIRFLDYPDGQLNQLWLDNWLTACPLRARYTRSTRSPYPQSNIVEQSYCGKNLIDEFQATIDGFKPDLILLPHPNDEHADHRATTSFMMMALSLEKPVNPEYAPLVMGYLVHYGFFPQPRGWHQNNVELPPVSLSGVENKWQRIDLTPDQIRIKGQAIRAYRSQLRLLGSFLPSFARSDEIFAILDFLDISPLAFNNLSLSESGVIQSPNFPEPMEENARQFVIGGADLVSLNVARLGSRLWLTAQTRSPLLPGLKYRLRVKLSDGETRTVTWPGSAIRTGSSTYSFQINLDEISNVYALGFAADVQQGMTLDRTGWRFMVLRDRIR
jgi:LmbE family N-acetylglucosaminyl deacetylase